MSIRSDHMALTRRAIIDAFLELATEQNAGQVTVADVARHSGVSQATIYRHFPGREALVGAAATDRMSIGVPESAEGWGLDEVRSHFIALWTEFAENMPLARQATVSDAGRELRKARFGTIRAVFDESIAAAGLDPESSEGKLFAAAMLALTSAHAFLDFHDRQGLSPEEAAATVAWAIEKMALGCGIDPAAIRIPGIPSREAENSQ
jgi:AcrR family transcriptional regulator